MVRSLADRTFQLTKVGYDYGTVKRPQGIFSNIFFAAREIPTILWADQWVVFRLIRHICGLSFWLGFMHLIYKDRPMTNL